jgi:DNA mismatch repair protein MutL
VSILILDESTASKIAAGEVVERPSSVVKELVENALDAGARRVEVEVREGGRGLIRVTDDGCGMTREDAVLSLQRHATSKIRTAEDLFSVATLGFRGEALPSIASVSHLALVTRVREAESGTKLTAVGGEVVELEDVGAPVGTQVSVSRLFYNTPARLKFLRRDAAEVGHITETCTRFLFSHPDAALRLQVEGREVIQHGGSGGLAAAVVAAWGPELAGAMVPLERQTAGLSVRGLVSLPAQHRATRNRQFLFVNNRWVRHRALTHALEEAFRGLLPERRFPAAVLLLEVEPRAVDVNVHPTKAEVRLSREPEIHHFLLGAVQEALRSAGAAGLHVAPPPPATGAGAAAASHPAEAGQQRGFDSGWAGTLAAPGVLSQAFQTAAGEQLELRPLAQLRETYILAESRGGLLLVDQHRAQERILYERFAQARLSQKGESQALLTPASVQLGAQEAAALEAHLGDLQLLGFDMEPFGRDAFLVRGVPVDLTDGDPADLVRDMAEELAAADATASVDRRRDGLLTALSCRSAIKAGDRLSYEEMAELLGALAGTARPYTCPHGWPIVMTISHFEIDRKFNR